MSTPDVEGVSHLQPNTYISAGTQTTIDLGKIIGTHVEAGDCLILTGDLGAGKTQLTKGIAEGLGVDDNITSPTFTIEMVYDQGRMPLYHFDLYRLNDPLQLEDTGLFDVLDADGVCVIEWGEQFEEEIGNERLDVIITRMSEESSIGEEPLRKINFISHGPRAHVLVDEIMKDLAR